MNLKGIKQMSEALKAAGVVHAYGKSGREVLSGLDLTMEAGSFEALMGPSGSGKSTFLHIAAGLVRPKAGTVLVGGEDITSMSDAKAARFRRANVGVVYQSFNLVDTLTVCENTVLPARLSGIAPDWPRFYTLVAKLGLKGLEERFPEELSGGERQRVAIARALFMQPPLILADEPTGNLDVDTAREMRDLLKSLASTEKSAILLVTHDPQMAAAADKVHFLKGGKIANSVSTGHDAAAVSAAYLETYK